MIPFIVGKNVVDEGNLTYGDPWDFEPDQVQLASLRSLSKVKRRESMQNPKTEWNIYSAIRGVALNHRVGGGNPAAGLRGLVADYDMKSEMPVVLGYINQMKAEFRPNFIEMSLGMKIRLVWVFEKEILVPNSDFCSSLISTFFKKMGVPTLLPGYDICSEEKPTTIWTNGGEWYDVNKVPMPWDLVFGMAVDVSKKAALATSEVPLELIAEQVEKRWPNRWQGAFELNALGVRFWDDSADNTSGCQVKPDGMLCFTGTKPFMKWAELLGPEWVNSQRALNLGKAAGEVYFDGRKYWKMVAGRWMDVSREDVILDLKTNGISAKAGKGQTASDAEKVLSYVQNTNRVTGAAPLINKKPGIVDLDGNRILNISAVKRFEPASKIDAGPADFPWLHKFINGLFDHSGAPHLSTDHFLAWLQRFYSSQYNYEADLGQAVFICGPHNNGKTLLVLKIVKPLAGNKVANPYDFLIGATSFNNEIFESPLLASNDEEAPARDETKQKLLARIKSFVVNPSHAYHPKFCNRINIEWTGRIMFTLNDDAGSVGILPETNSNTQDKLSFYASKPYQGKWGNRQEVEGTIERELPFFARWLLDTYQPPAEVIIGGRMGTKSFFDPTILEISKQQSYSYNLLEIVREWIKIGAEWENKEDWTGNPTGLRMIMFGHESLSKFSHEWSFARVSKSLTSLARVAGTGIESVGGDREFKITKSLILKKEGEAPTK